MKLPNTLVIATALVSSLIACSQQGQGERCLTANGNADCEAGLVCTPKEELRESQTTDFAADRCCPPIDGPRWSDPRCETRDARITPAAGGSGNSTAPGGAAGSADTAQAGAATSPSETSETGGSASTDPSGSTATAGSGA